ncbi:hypothetical protein TcCL_ESM03754 [Trypanosoma cruzi]|nr:hypothetical protein TcCL_ESM03754 [Trypanosoma cruzi]
MRDTSSWCRGPAPCTLGKVKNQCFFPHGIAVGAARTASTSARTSRVLLGHIAAPWGFGGACGGSVSSATRTMLLPSGDVEQSPAPVCGGGGETPLASLWRNLWR